MAASYHGREEPRLRGLLLAARGQKSDRESLETRDKRGPGPQENLSWTLGPAAAQVVKFMASLKEYPPRAESFQLDIDELMRNAQDAGKR